MEVCSEEERRQPPAHLQVLQAREEGATLSPPNTWTSSSADADSADDDGESRLLFTATFALPQGTIHSAIVFSDQLDAEYLPLGGNFMERLEAKGRSFVLSAAAASTRQRIFSRVIMPDMSARACELLCEFEPERAKVTALTIRPAFGPTVPFHPFAFTTKHSANCALTHIDYASIPYLGLLPTDLIGKSILAFVYAPDVHVIRQAHIDLHNARGKVVKSVADVRLVAHNGALLRAQCEWSAYVNPWTRKMELVVVRHRILGVPIGAADVLAQPTHTPNVLPAVMAKTFEDELRAIMNRPVPSRHHHHQPPPAAAGVAQQAVPRHPLRQSVRVGTAVGPTTTTTAATTTATGPLGLPQADLGLYLDKLVETLVVNSTPPKVEPTPPVAKEADLPLSYTQINALENVCRLLKSQSNSRPESPAVVSSTSTAAATVSTSTLPGRSVDDVVVDRKFASSLPLTKELLLQHTKRFEDECKDIWNRRLKRLSEDSCSPPPAKQSRPNICATPPLHWTLAQKQEFYRSLAPNPPPPPGKNYQITYTPLVDEAERQADSDSESTTQQRPPSAFTAVQPRCVPVRELPSPIRLSIVDAAPPPPSVIQTPCEPLVVPLNRLLWPRTSSSAGLLVPSSPPVLTPQQQQQASSLAVLRDRV